MLDNTFLKGIIIGLSISVPLGPIGMLIIQRTLNRGRKYGLITGLGATVSDLLYAVVTMFFINFVIGVIEHHKTIIQLVGSLIVVGFGLYTYRSNPVTQPLPHEKKVAHSMTGDFFSSFLLTLSNPLILFVLIALFAHLEFISSSTTLFEHFWGIFSILCGACLWWALLTYLVSHFRNKFNIRELKLINHITGAIIMLLGVAGIAMSLLK